MDEAYIRMAIQLAKKALGKTWPNPMVGAVLVKEGSVIATGFHKRFGSLHAEAEALEAAGPKARGATLFVNLEPCSHWGKTPPCAERILRSGVKRVVVSMVDPNPLVSGRGIMKLVRGGVEVKIGVLEREAVYLNEVFVINQILKRPFVHVKIASTLDGKIATPSGHSKWITSLESRKKVHSLRALYDAVLVGVGTVVKDNPRLNVRLVEGRDPRVFIIDPSLKTPLSSEVLKRRITIFASPKAPVEKSLKLRAMGVDIIYLEGFSPGEVLSRMWDLGVRSILVEGGGKVFNAFLKNGPCDKVTIFISGKLFGEGVSFFQDRIERVEEALKISIRSASLSGGDVEVEGYINDPYEVYRCSRAL